MSLFSFTTGRLRVEIKYNISIQYLVGLALLPIKGYSNKHFPAKMCSKLTLHFLVENCLLTKLEDNA